MAKKLSLDSKLVDAALEVSGESTRQAADTRALEEFIARRRNQRLLELMGKLKWDTGYHHKAERFRR
ncbi:MAG: type II toxin-antitoxin system VapB family antitoxin [Proteobacteria bacterium]|nr:type II toxin-antitoxin system VapB family antitoxin [Pseudomonadota bacterium]